MSTEYHSAQEDFNILISKLPPWVMSNFVIWLDLKVAEYKIFGRILSESEKYEAKEFFTGHSTKSADSHASQESTPRQNTSIHHQHQQRNEVGPFPEILVKVQPRNTTTNRPPKRKRPDKASYLSKRGIQQTSIDKGSASSQSQESCLPELGLRIIDSSGNPLDGDLCNKQTAECVNLDTDENTNDSEPVDSEPVDTKPEEGLLMEVSNESEIEQRETLSETQSSGLVSVIKLELPDNDVYQVLPTMQQSNESEMNIQSSSSWQPPSTSNEESLTTDASVAAEIEKSLQAGNVILNYPDYSSINKSNISQVKDSTQAECDKQEVDGVLKFLEKAVLPGYELKMCNVCFGLFDSNFQVMNHFRVDHPGSMFMFACIYCGEGFSNEGKLGQHIVTNHMGKRSTTCILCGKTFMQLQHFKGHLNTHRGVQAFKCKTCNRSFTYKTHLTCHERQCGGLNGKYECKICHRQFLMRSHLSEHMHGIHTKSKPRYSCDYCKERFVWRGSCIRHKKKCSQNPTNMQT